MPDRAGMIPDVGATYFLPRLQSSTPHLGVYLALTNGRLRGADLRQTRIATHFVHSDLVLSSFLFSLLSPLANNLYLEWSLDCQSTRPFAH